MAAQIIPKEPALKVDKFSILGKYATPAESRVVEHLAMVRENSSLTHGSQAKVWHMQPPLVAGGQESKCMAHVAAWLNLSPDEKEGIVDWLAEVDKENRPTLPSWNERLQQYTVSMDPKDEWFKARQNPDGKWVADENGIQLYRKFNCVSFVLSAYEHGAYIKLIDTDASKLNISASRDFIASAYRIMQVLNTEQLAVIGLEGDSPLPVLMPGYVCHAMNREDEAIRAEPYRVPGLQAAHFPMPTPTKPIMPSPAVPTEKPVPTTEGGSR